MYSLSETGRLLDLDRRTVADICRINKIALGRHPHNGMGKAVDEHALRCIRAIRRRMILKSSEVQALTSA